MSGYKQDFYADRHGASLYAAQVILEHVRAALPPIRSAVDLGCGVGTWLSVFRSSGVERVVGMDGPWVDKSLLEIPPEDFRVENLEQPLTFDPRFDLAISLEVAEHLSPESAATFVGSLTDAADFVLFSAAVPFQGGSRHVNEQWPEYWADLFNDRDFEVVDCIRSLIWKDEKIPTWYRQNTFLYVLRSRLTDLNLELAGRPFPELAVINPDAFLDKVSTLKVSWRTFRKALRRRLFGIKSPNPAPRSTPEIEPGGSHSDRH